MELSRRQGFYFGAKLVRGAYIEQERKRAQDLGYEDPINPDYETTSAMYEKNLDFFMENIIETGLSNQRFAIMVATHNEDTVRYTLKRSVHSLFCLTIQLIGQLFCSSRMEDHGILPKHKVICFGQLYGMSDHISFTLGQSGYSVYKYVPYGPIDKVMPYLSRRALENHSVLNNSKHERQLLFDEIWRRIKSGQLFYKPVGKYQPI